MATELDILNPVAPTLVPSTAPSAGSISGSLSGPSSGASPSHSTANRRLAVLNARMESPQPSEMPTDEEQTSYSTADKLPVGSTAHVVAVSARCSELRHKLLSLGVVAGTKLEVTGVAPLGDPINVRLLGFTLSLRLCEAQCIRVERPL